MSAPKIEIALNENGEIFWNGTALTQDQLRANISKLTSESSVSVRGDKKAFFNDFICVLDQLKLKQIEKISIVTQRES